MFATIVHWLNPTAKTIHLGVRLPGVEGLYTLESCNRDATRRRKPVPERGQEVGEDFVEIMLSDGWRKCERCFAAEEQTELREAKPRG